MGRVMGGLIVALLLASSCSGDDDSTAVDNDPVDDPTDIAAPDPGADAAATDDAADATPITFEVLGRAEYVTGGDVLVAYDGDDVSPAFTAGGAALDAEQRADGVFLVSGLPDGPSVIEVGAASLEVVNHPITGPVFSGPHQEPLFCALDRFDLEPTGDDDCSAETTVAYLHLDDAGEFVPVPEAGPPADALVIRVERGTINRGIYEIVVADPSMGAEPIEPGKNLMYLFGGGCGTGHIQASGLLEGSDTLDADALAAGYIIATSTFNVLQTHCNDVLAAETLMMVQERVNETVGPIGLTVGRGGSGGAIQQYVIVQAYPGLLDAVHSSVSFPDSASVAGGVTDCGLLLDFFGSEAGSAFTDEQRLAIQGHGSLEFCDAWQATFLPNISPSVGCDASIPVDEIYDADANPEGIRCTLQDSVSNVYGVDEQGFGRRALDNVGVQYGLVALNDGVITVDEFLDLNQAIGGYDIDGVIVDERIAADPEVVELSYSTGRVLQGDSAVLDVPIIDVDLYSDLGFDIHDRFRLFSIRERMANPDGSRAGNRVIWTRSGVGLLAAVSGDDAAAAEEESKEAAVGPSSTEIIELLVEWATTGTRPAGVADDCVIDGERIVGDEVFDDGQPCAEAYPYFGDPRVAAGAPLANDIVKCQPVPVDSTGYEVSFTATQAARLAEVFPDGVCDWSVPGVGQVPLTTWLEY